MDREPVVTLSKWELVLGALTGAYRAIDVIMGSWENRARGIDADGRIWTRHIEGALAEIAVAKVLDRFWTGSVRTFTGGDVGELQVRCRIAEPMDQAKRLIVQQKDSPEDVFVLVVGRAPAYRVVGWIQAARAQQQVAWIQNPGNYGEAFFVPQDALEEIRFLPEPARRAA
jgi:hypothetical protein